ncbi:MAG: arginine--tRNA ligase [Candidatus Gastranaerophilales bacterium]
MIKSFFINEIQTAVQNAINNNELGEMTEYKGSLAVERPKNVDFGDYAVNVSSFARFAKISPPQIANAIVKYIDATDNEYTVVGGFINFKAGRKLLAEVVKDVFDKKENFAKPEKIDKEKIILEYVSANPTGPFHIGHGRWAAMGSALANLLKFYGHDVYQEFYINDAGSQILKLGNSLSIRIKQELGEDVDFPTDEVERKNYYAGDYLIPVAKKFLQENEPTDDAQILSNYAKKEMLELQKDLLKDFRVDFDKFYSELDLHNSGEVENCVEKLKKSGKIYMQDDACWFKSSDFGDDQDRVIKKADGSNTYLTADIAYHIDKLERGFDRMINIWGADHHGYVARVKASIEALGYSPEKLEVLLGQLVNLVIDGNEVRMGKRKNMVTLEDLINEVGVDATRFWMCMRNIDTTLDFDIELAKTNSDENPIFYVQYAHARACSILRNLVAEKIDTQTGEKINAPLSVAEYEELINNINVDKLLPAVDGGRKLILKLEEYHSVIKNSAINRQVYTICRYVQELASEFHSFYNSNRVILDDVELMKSRVALVFAVKTVLSSALENILDVNAPERM